MAIHIHDEETSLQSVNGRNEPVHMLLVEHDESDVELCLAELRRANLHVVTDVVQTPEEFSERLGRGRYDIILSDYRLPGWTALDALAIRDQLGLDIPFVLVTGTLGEEVAVHCIKLGIADYVLKDNLARLSVAILAALKEKELRRERAKAERALRESEATFRVLFANNPLPMYVFDRETLAFLEVNETACRQYGYTREEFLRLNLTQIRPEGEIPRLISFLATLRETLLDAGVWKHRAKDGRIFDTQATYHAFEFAGRPAGLMVVQDITEKISLERQLRQAQKFEAFGQLAGGVAHDFNNIIGAILAWAELGMERAGAGNALAEYFEKVKKQAGRAAVLTRQLLAFARRQVLEPRPMDLNQSARDVLSLLEKIIGGNIELQSRLDASPALICADPGQIEQVLLNLCLNARDAMPQGGELRVETTHVTLDEDAVRHSSRSEPGEHVLLTVTDEGMGMDAATLERIFEPFFTTKEVGKGTGLGLATVYGIVKQHGGFIDIHSEPGHGSSFRVFFPVTQEPVAKPSPQLTEPSPRRGTETILLAEDHEGLREIARECLARLGYRVLVAADGHEAIQLFEAQPDAIALVFLDVVLPKISGPDVYRRISNLKPLLPVLFTTGYSEELADIRNSLPEGVTILAKPFSARELALKVREILNARESQPGASHRRSSGH